MLKEVVLGAAVLLVGWEVSSVEGPSGGWVASPNQSRVHKVQTGDAAIGARILAEGGKRLVDYGNFQLYQTGPELAQPGTSVQAALRDDYNLLLLNSAHLDTSRPEIQELRKTVVSFAGRRMHLVQFVGPVLPPWREALLGCGIQIVSYIPNNAYLIYGDATGIAAVQALATNQPHIQWEGPYLDAYKIHPAARLMDARGQPRQIGTDRFALQLIADPQLNQATLQLVDQLKLEPIQRQESALHYLNLIVRLTPSELKALAAQPDVISIQPYFTPRKLCERQAQIVAGNLSAGLLTGPGYLAWLESKGFNQAQFDASRFVVDVSDSGIDNGTTAPGHFGLYRQGMIGDASRVAYSRLEGMRSAGSTLAGCDGHGALNAHIIAGYDDQSGFPFSDQEGYHYGLGICPFVKLGSSVIFDPDNFTSPNFNNLQARAYQAGARVSNNSWGSAVSGAYDMDAQNFDALVRDAQPSGSVNASPDNQQMVIVVAAGNDGPSGQTIDSPATGKNVISVGGAENQQAIGGADGSGIGDDQADDGEDIISFSSEGPCADLRHKPDLVAPCTHVSGGVPQQANPGADGTALACFDGTGVSGGAGSMFFPSCQEFYTSSSGTSHATPCVSGGCALVRQYFINNFTNAPSPAMVKAYLMNSARYMTGLYADDTLWSDSQGMGEMNLGMAFDGTPRLMRDQLAEDLFTASGQVRTFSGSISDTNKPFRVTLAWTDAPGSTTAAAYNNDLDLFVTIGGSNYYGNVFAGAFSVSGGSPDAINNVESVLLPAGTSGAFVVTVSAANINSDGVPGNPYALDQDFALVVYNAQGVVPPSILLEPTNQTALAGANVSFQAQVSGTAPLSYQWHFKGLDVVGATSSTLVLTNIQPNQMGPYWLTVTNAAGWNSTVEAWLKVLVQPSLTAVQVNGAITAVLLSSATGLTYTLQYKNALSDPQWIPVLAPISGNGGNISFVDTNLAPVSRFYRVLCY